MKLFCQIEKLPNSFLFQLDQGIFGISREYLIKGVDDKLVQAYHSYQIDTAVIYGADELNATEEMREALDFEITLANVKALIETF